MKFRRMTVGLFVALLMLLGVSALYGERYWSINHDTITNPTKLEVVMNRQDQTLDENTTLSTELRTDAATHRTFELEAKADLLTDYTAITNLNNATHELTDDAATNRTFLLELQTDAVTQGTFNTNVKATAGELADDAATNRTAIVNLKATAGEAADDMGSMRTSVLAIRALGTTGDFLITPTALSQGSNLTCVSNIAFGYVINGATYYKAALTTGTALTAATIHQNAYGGWRILVNASGTISVQAAAANATGGYSSVNEAIAGLPAITADNASMGAVYVTDSNSVFVAGTDNLNASGVTATYYNGNSGWYYLGQTTAPAAAMTYTSGTLTNPAAAMTYTSGTLTNGPTQPMTASPAATVTYTGTLTNPAPEMTASPPAATTAPAPTDRVSRGK